MIGTFSTACTFNVILAVLVVQSLSFWRNKGKKNRSFELIMMLVVQVNLVLLGAAAIFLFL